MNTSNSVFVSAAQAHAKTFPPLCLTDIVNRSVSVSFLLQTNFHLSATSSSLFHLLEADPVITHFICGLPGVWCNSYSWSAVSPSSPSQIKLCVHMLDLPVPSLEAGNKQDLREMKESLKNKHWEWAYSPKQNYMMYWWTRWQGRVRGTTTRTEMVSKWSSIRFHIFQSHFILPKCILKWLFSPWILIGKNDTMMQTLAKSLHPIQNISFKKLVEQLLMILLSACQMKAKVWCQMQ